MSLIWSYLLPSFNLVALEKKFSLRIYWRLFVFWYVKVCVLRKFTQPTMHWDKTQILKKFPSYNINVKYKLSSFFLGELQLRHSFIFNLWYELKHKVRLSKAVRGIIPFSMPIYIFDRQNAWALTLIRHNSFQN